MNMSKSTILGLGVFIAIAFSSQAFAQEWKYKGKGSDFKSCAEDLIQVIFKQKWNQFESKSELVFFGNLEESRAHPPIMLEFSAQDVYWQSKLVGEIQGRIWVAVSGCEDRKACICKLEQAMTPSKQYRNLFEIWSPRNPNQYLIRVPKVSL